jgi:mannose-6-phosphate isomerase-like protein (cupin superfamily)
MTPAESKFLLDPYLDWTKREGIPVHEGVAVDLFTAETGPWPRMGDGCRGAFVHLDGRGDWMTVFLIDLPPGGASAPQQHLYDEVLTVLSGAGSMVVETLDGRDRTFEFEPGSIFAPPLNARYRLSNSSDREPVRLACANDLRILMNIFHDEAFFFDNPFAFPERGGNPALPGEVSMQVRPGEIPAGTYEPAQHERAGCHMLCMQGSGYTLLWYRGSQTLRRIDWRPGLCFALPENMVHQHFNIGTRPARYLATGFGTRRHPIVEARRADLGRTDAADSETGQDSRVQALWLDELRKAGAGSEMTHGLPVHSRLA